MSLTPPYAFCYSQWFCHLEHKMDEIVNKSKILDISGSFISLTNKSKFLERVCLFWGILLSGGIKKIEKNRKLLTGKGKTPRKPLPRI